MSGRSGCASSAALRPAFACDRASAGRRADPRCSPSSRETLGRCQRLHTRVWPLGARTLRRNGSYRPRGGFHHHPPVCDAPARFAPLCGAGSLVGTPKCPSGGGIQPARRVPAAMAPEAAGTQRAHRRRETRAGAARTARVTAARHAAASRPEESRRAARGGQASAEGPRTRGAKNQALPRSGTNATGLLRRSSRHGGSGLFAKTVVRGEVPR